MKISRIAVCALCAASAAFSAEPIEKPAPLSPYIYIPGPASYVAGPHVVSAQFSASGRYVLMSMTTPEGARKQADMAARANENTPFPGFAPLSVVIWNRRTHRASVTWTAPWEATTLGDVCWLPGSDTALVSLWARDLVTLPDKTTIKRLVFHVMQMDPRRENVLERDAVLGGPSTHLEISPRQPIALLCDGGESTSSIRILRQNAISEPIPIPNDTSDFGPKWSADGAIFYMRVFGPGSDFELGKNTSWLAVDTGKETTTPIPALPVDAVASVGEDPPALPFAFIGSEASVKDGARSFLAHPLWLDCGAKDVFLLHPDAGNPEASRQSDAVVYLADGFAFLRGLERKPRPPQPPTPALEVKKG